MLRESLTGCTILHVRRYETLAYLKNKPLRLIIQIYLYNTCTTHNYIADNKIKRTYFLIC